MRLRIRSLLLLLPVFIPGITSFVYAENELSTVQSLDTIISQSSDLPELLTSTPLDMPDITTDKQTSAGSSSAISPSPRLSNPVSESLLRDKLSSTQKALSQHQHQLQVLTQELSTANRALAELRGQKDNPSEVAEAQRALQEQQKKVVALTQKLDDANMALSRMKAKKDNELKLQEVTKSLVIQQEKVQELTKKLEHANGNIALLTEDKARGIKTAETTQAALTRTESDVNTLKDKLAALTATHIDTSLALAKAEALESQHIAQFKNELKHSQALSDKLEIDIGELKTRSATQEKANAELKEKLFVPSPETGEQRKAYSLGAHWGQEIIDAMAQLETSNVTLNLQQVSSGVNDALKNELKISRNEIANILSALTQTASTEQQSLVDTNKNKGKLYTEVFAKIKGVRKSAMGYYYLIESKGTGTIKDSDVVEVTVKESLTDGKVIKDMVATGRTLTLPLNKLPPLFSSAIGLIGNQGHVKLVVPPELAYGEQGRPPEIPPSWGPLGKRKISYAKTNFMTDGFVRKADSKIIGGSI